MPKAFFTGRVIAEWLVHDPREKSPDDRLMQIAEPFKFTDAKGLEWVAPAGLAVDGASIPQIGWFIISPYIGDYRRASVIHDFYCDVHLRPWRDTHRMFHEAMLTDGTDAIKAGVMFAAVYAFGPRWPDPAAGLMNLSMTENTRLTSLVETPPDATDAIWTQISARDFGAIRARIEKEGLGVTDIEAAIDAAPAERIIAATPQTAALEPPSLFAAAPRRLGKINLEKVRPKAAPASKAPAKAAGRKLQAEAAKPSKPPRDKKARRKDKKRGKKHKKV